ncbi:uncharacterized protein I303_108265 [Kwoniella dejecticola CBS 10117]|uniref:Nicotinamide-nucleotide adenylyltransferase n=1 Tax=Kwoniella dejecticola CBS 10117 TaxID=1296121 RepID=A0A1A5ZXW6_9TREE|nr:uncharacterized protein I303_07408 [Kwoniella dejecticola CBS 10117]OBR82646.1 hypothetical protein I303_07408 [Kwoniella dejecticola CBS 10117]
MTSSTSLHETINRISSTPGSFQLISSPPNWPRPNSSSGSSQSSDLHIAILDSSFNPPTSAHRQIAFSAFPPPSLTAPSPREVRDDAASSSSTRHPGPYTSRLLLFSARNVEKTSKASDATVAQRLEMMSILSRSHPDTNTAIGLINEPTFVGKSSIIRSYLSTQPIPGPPNENEDAQGDRELDVKLSFLVGTDTLIRFFDPRFYPPNQMEDKLEEYFDSGSYLISARRGKDSTDRAIEEEILNRDGAKQWVQSGHLRLLGTGNEGWEEISSTKVREAVSKQDWELVDDLVGQDIREYVRKEGLYIPQETA